MDNNFLFRAEDDNEFIPLFSFNEQDMEGDKDMVVDDIIPILPLRNTVLFPGVVIPITVGRDKSIQAVKAAYNKDKLIGVVSQKDGNIEDPTPSDLCAIGTVAKIIKMIKMQDGGTTIIIQGKKRFQLLEMKEEDPFFKASIKVLVEEKVGKEDQNFQAYLSNIKDLATQIIQLSPNFPSEAAMILKNIENPLFLINFVSSNLNVTINEKQALLETINVNKRKIELEIAYDDKKEKLQQEYSNKFDALNTREEVYKNSYEVRIEKLEKERDDLLASIDDDKHTNDQYLCNQTLYQYFWETLISSLPFDTFEIPDMRKKIIFSNYEICRGDLYFYERFKSKPKFQQLHVRGLSCSLPYEFDEKEDILKDVIL